MDLGAEKNSHTFILLRTMTWCRCGVVLDNTLDLTDVKD